MLISFSVSNCRSFLDEVTFSLTPATLRQHPEHVIKTSATCEALRMALLFGANASGKSNLLHALALAVRSVLDNTCTRLADSQFRLPGCANREMSFSFVFAKTHKYCYSFTTDGATVLSETLEWHKVRGEREVLFARTGERVRCSKALSSDWYSWRTLEPHMFWLRKLEEDGIRGQAITGQKLILEALDFLHSFCFLNTLPMLGIQHMQPFFLEGTGFREFLRDLLHKADVGISDIVLEELPQAETDRILSIPKQAGTRVVRIVQYTSNPARYLYFSRKTPEEPFVGHEVKTKHGETSFPLNLESDGTKRLFELSAVLWQMMHQDLILVADEIDAFLHPILTRGLLEALFKHAHETSQAILTTHCTSLLSTDLLRSDEVWMTEKRYDGSTDLYPLVRFMPRADKRLERGYLNGVYGAVPAPGDFFDANGETE